MTTRKFAHFSVWGAVRGLGLIEFFFCRQFALKPDQSINEIRESIESSLRSNHFRAVSEQRTRNESERPREKWLVPFLALPKPKIPFLGLFLLRNHMETLAMQVKLKRAVFFVCLLLQDQLTHWGSELREDVLAPLMPS